MTTQQTDARELEKLTGVIGDGLSSVFDFI